MQPTSRLLKNALKRGSYALNIRKLFCDIKFDEKKSKDAVGIGAEIEEGSTTAPSKNDTRKSRLSTEKVWSVSSNPGSECNRKIVTGIKKIENWNVRKVSRSVDRSNESDESIPEEDKTAARRKYSTISEASSLLPEIPGPRGLPLVGTTLSLIRAGGAAKLHEYVDKRHRELGPVYKERMGAVEAVFVSSPSEYRKIFRLEGTRPKHFLPDSWILYNNMRKCRRGLFFMEGDEWLHHRRIVNKLLLRPDSEDFMIEPCKEAAKSLVEDFKVYAEKGVAVPQLEKKLYQWSIEVMLAILMGSTWPEHKSNILSRSKNLAVNLNKIFEYSGQLSLIPVKLAMNLKLPLWKKFVNSVDNTLEIVQESVKEMVRLEGNGLIKMFTNEGIRDEDLVRIVADLILAAGDTTAYSMQWGLFLLSGNPEVQEELLSNLKTGNGKKATEEPLLKGVIKEALRLYPTAPFLTRFLPEDSVVGGYRVLKGDLILMSLYTSGHDSKNFPNAEKFSPKRWLRNKKGDYSEVINPHASLPFAMGARSCVGRKIAETQLTLSMGEVIKNFKIECVNRERVKMILHLVSVPSEPVQLLMKSRY